MCYTIEGIFNCICVFSVPVTPKLLNVHNLVNKQTDKTNQKPGDHEDHPDQEEKHQQENDDSEQKQDHEERRLSGKFSGLQKMKKLRTIQR